MRTGLVPLSRVRRWMPVTFIAASTTLYVFVTASAQHPTSLTEKILINGVVHEAPPGATLAQIFSEEPLLDLPGSLYALNGEVIKANAFPSELWVNGERATLRTRVPPGGDVRVVHGRDQTETAEIAEVDFGLDYGPQTWYTLWMRGTPGKMRVVRGSISGVVVSETIVSEPEPARDAKGQPVAALTFDDGPDPTWTPVVLEILKTKRVRATFFVLGSRVERYPELTKLIADEGHSVQNHTWNHPFDIYDMPTEQIEDEIRGTSDAVFRATGKRPSVFRPPFGALTPAIYEAVTHQNVRVIMWNLDPRDWRGATSEEIYERVTTQIGGGDIILLHDGGGNRGQTTGALPGIIDKLHSEGFSFVTIE